MENMGKKAYDQAVIDDFNRMQLEKKNNRKQNEQEKNVMFANQRSHELELLDGMNEKQKQDAINQKRLYGQTLLYQSAVQDQLKKNYGKMTMQEKRLNKVDLTVSINFV